MRIVGFLIVLQAIAARGAVAQGALLASGAQVVAQDAAGSETKGAVSHLLEDEWPDIRQMFTPGAA